MGNIVVATNMTLDGVVQDPDGQEGCARGGWYTRSLGSDREAWAELYTEGALDAAALLLGRTSDAWFADRWIGRPGPWARRLNSLPKYVVSSTLAQPTWTNATLVRGDVAAEVTKLKQGIDGDIVVYASYALVRMLIEHDLVDELRLVVFPVVLGAGERLFGALSDEKPVRLIETRIVGSGLTYLTYAFEPRADQAR